MEHRDFFQALHSPLGANAGFALGLKHAGGGFSLEKDRVPDQDVFVGIRKDGVIRCLPFFKGSACADMDSFVKEDRADTHISPFSDDSVERRFGYGLDVFSAPGLTFSLACPVRSIPEPGTTLPSAEADAVAPAIIARMEMDNREGKTPVQGIFALSPVTGKVFLGPETGGTLLGVRSKEGYGFAARPNPDAAMEEIADFDLPRLFSRHHPLAFMLAPMTGLLVEVKAGCRASIDIALAWYRGGDATQGLRRCRYWYTRHFSGIVPVLEHALERSDAWMRTAQAQAAALEALPVSPDRRFLMAQAVNSYGISSMLFDDGESPRWVVNEGTYMMLNTLDLTIDHAFFELRCHPWVVRNQLDSFLDDYSYRDHCGLSFCHDQGIHHTFSPRGNSSYEIPDIPGCFSYMTQEQLCNWSLTAALYVRHTGDSEWLMERASVFRECAESLVARDGPETDRDGVMDVDSSRCGAGAEITTYDSLDPSLGQARRNLYVAVKCIVTYHALASLLTGTETPAGKALASRCQNQAALGAATVTAAFDPVLGWIPALLDGRDKSAIIPAIEALVYLPRLGMGNLLEPGAPLGALADVLRRHIAAVLVPGRCLFPDGGWRLSATSDNSWMSKIFVSQYVAESVLGHDADQSAADKAHADWWRLGCPSNPGIDQIFAGTQAERGFHYPRAVTSDLWWPSPRGLAEGKGK